MTDATNGFGFNDTIQAGADLSSHQYKVVNISGTIAASIDTSIGVLQNKPKSGEAATVKVLGKMMGLAGGSISASGLLKVTSGYLVAVASGDRVAPCGKALVAADSGDIFTFMGNFINGGVILTSSY